MTKLPKFLALAALAAGCGDYARSGVSPADAFYYPTGMAVGHVPAGCVGGTPGCQTRLYVASSNFDLRYDLETGGALTGVDPDTGRRVGPPVRMGSFAGDVALVDPATCPGFTGDPLVLVASRSSRAVYGMSLSAEGVPSCGDGCAQALDPFLRDPFAVTVSCRGASGTTAWISFLGRYQGVGWVQPLALPGLASAAAQTSLAAPAQSLAYDPTHQRLYSVTVYGGTTTPGVYYSTLGLGAAGQFSLPVPAEASAIAISADGTRAYVALRLFNSLVASTVARPADVGGALAVVDLTEQPAGGPAGTLLRLVPLGLGASRVRTVDRRAAGLRDLVAVACTDDSTLHLYDDEVGAVALVVGADARGSPLLGRRPFGLAVEAPWQGAAALGARIFVGSFDDGTVSTVVLDDLRRPGQARVLPDAVTAGAP